MMQTKFEYIYVADELQLDKHVMSLMSIREKNFFLIYTWIILPMNHGTGWRLNLAMLSFRALRRRS